MNIKILVLVSVGITYVQIALAIVLLVTMFFTSVYGWAVERVAYRPLRGSFLFFQAEDGIRVIGVTGVQTCALPIFFRGVFVLGFREREQHPPRRLDAF